MALFFFHLRDGVDRLLDPDGRDLPDIQAVKQSSLREARGLISHEALCGQINMAQAIEVEDDAGVIVHRLDFHKAVTIVAKITSERNFRSTPQKKPWPGRTEPASFGARQAGGTDPA